MKLSILTLVAFILSAHSLVAESLPETKIYAALGMTKSQKSSPVPTDSGVFLYDTSDQRWHRFGPTIQQVNSISADPSNPQIIYLACGNGIVRSQNNGITWKLVTGWRESDITKIAVDPANGQNIYAASAWGVTISRDGGENWSAANKGLVERFSKSIIVDHLNPKRILLATTAGLFISEDSAETWTQNPTAPEIAILRLDRNKTNPSLWIAGTEGKGVIISSDDGQTWRSTAPELSEANVYGVGTDSSNSQVLAAGGWGTGIWVSADGGTSWTYRGDGLPSQNITATTFDQSHSGRLWASTFEEGTFYSDDLGKSWHSDDLIVPGGRGSILGAYVNDLGVIPVKN